MIFFFNFYINTTKKLKKESINISFIKLSYYFAGMKSSKEYTLVFSNGGEKVAKFNKVPRQFLEMLGYFKHLFSSQMMDANQSTIRIEYPIITQEGVMQYMNHLRWRYNGCQGPDPAMICDPEVGALAEYLGDEKFFVDFFAGGSIKIYRVGFFPEFSKDFIYQFDVEPGYYDGGTDNPSKVIFDLVGSQLQKIYPGFKLQVSNNIAIISNDLFILYRFKTTGSFELRECTDLEIMFSSRQFNMKIADDYPKFLPESVQSVISTQYVVQIASTKGNGYRKLANFTTKDSRIAKVIWDGANRRDVVMMLGVPKKSHNKASKLEFDKIFKYADGIAKLREPQAGFDFSNDATLTNLEARINELYAKNCQGIITRQIINIQKNQAVLYSHKSISDDSTLVTILNLEKQWYDRYDQLAKSATKKIPLVRPQSIIY